MNSSSIFPLASDLSCDFNLAANVGESFNVTYSSAIPYPHICIDNFLDPAILYTVLNDLKSLPEPADTHTRSQENLKYSFNPETLPENSRNLFRFFNSRPFVLFLENLTGIKGLISDPMFLGGGVHEVKNGGHLDIHADFNLHGLMKTERRINVLIYLNEDWKSEYGGQFEIWDNKMTHCITSFDPIFNRCVIFNTDSDSFHGNPNTVKHPFNISRRSIALYYYTATWDGDKRSHTTQFKLRPGTKDRADWAVKRKEIFNDFIPPIISRLIIKSAKFINKI